MTNPENLSDNPDRKRRILTPEERREKYIRQIAKVKQVMFDRELKENDALLQPTIGPGGVKRVRGYSLPARVSDMNDGGYFISGIAYSGQSLVLESYDAFSNETIFVDYDLETNEAKAMRQSVDSEGERVNEVIIEGDDKILANVLFRAYDLCNPPMTTPYEEEAAKRKGGNIYKFQLPELQDMQEPLF